MRVMGELVPIHHSEFEAGAWGILIEGRFVESEMEALAPVWRQGVFLDTCGVLLPLPWPFYPHCCVRG